MFVRITLIVLALSVSTTRAAEICFTDRAVTVQRSVVTLGDIADVAGTGSEALRQTVLFPSPARGETLTVNPTTLRDTLSYLGISAAEHRFFGSQTITITTNPVNTAPTNTTTNTAQVTLASYFARENTKHRIDQVYLPTLRVKEMEASLAQSISDYLNACVAASSPGIEPYPWVIALKLDPLVAKQIDSAGGVKNIFGGRNPIIGSQEIGVVLASGATIPITVDVTLPVEAVVLQRAVPRGKRITADDVTVSSLTRPGSGSETIFQQASEVIGMETLQSLREGTALTRNMLTPPTLVRKNETVTVYSRAAGIDIKTYGKCKDDGTLGTVVQIERQDRQRDTFFARVTGHGTVEVSANAATISR